MGAFVFFCFGVKKYFELPLAWALTLSTTISETGKITTMTVTPQDDRDLEWQAFQSCNLTQLRERDLEILKYYYERNMSLRAVGDAVGLSREGVRKAIARLKKELLPQSLSVANKDCAFVKNYFSYLPLLRDQLERRVIKLFYENGLQVGEIAEIAGIEFIDVSRIKNRGETRLRLIKAIKTLADNTGDIDGSCIAGQVTIARCSYFGALEAKHKEALQVVVEADGLRVRSRSCSDRVSQAKYESPVLVYRGWPSVKTETDLYALQKDRLFGLV